MSASGPSGSALGLRPCAILSAACLGADQAKTIIDDMESQVRATWYATARGAGVSERDCEKIAGAFAYPGFRKRDAGR